MLGTIFVLLSAIFSGVLLFLAFPEYDKGWLGWIGLVPVLVAISGKKSKHSFLVCLLCGIVFFSGVFRWVFEIPGYRLIHHIALIPYMALYFGLLGILFSFISKRWSVYCAMLTSPFLWVSLEYIRSNLGFLSLPWALLGHSQYQYPMIIQFVSFTGVYGVSFLLVLANASLATAILTFSPRGWVYRRAFGVKPSKSQAGWILMAASGSLVLVSTYGSLTLGKTNSLPGIDISVIQGNIDRQMKADPKAHANFIMEKYSSLTRQAAKAQPDLIVWPEAATPGFVLKDMGLVKKIVSLVKETKVYFLIGSSEYPKFIKSTSLKQTDIGNTALFFSPHGKVLGQYLKIHLVPFGEYVPLDNVITWPTFIVPEEKRSFEVPGKEHTLFKMEETKFGVLICWEIVFPELFREFVREGANFMLNITNEGWFGPTAAPYQLASISVFRAVENRISLARAANTGVSCFIDPHGRIMGKVQNQGKDIFVEGYLMETVALSQEETFYTQHGDVFLHFVLVITVAVLGLSYWKGKRSSWHAMTKRNTRHSLQS